MQIVVKLFSIVIMSLVGLIAAAFIVYSVIGSIYIVIFGDGPVANSYECARGMAVGWLSLLAGAILGLCAGAYGGYRFFKLNDLPHD